MRAKQSNGRGLEGFGMNLAAFDYGCHCNALLTGKPFGVGRPVDPLDSVCKSGAVSLDIDFSKYCAFLYRLYGIKPILQLTQNPQKTLH